MPNPNVPLGTINRLLASVVWNSFPALNITPSYLAPEAIDVTPEGVMTTMLPTMTGFVTSPEPWMPFRMVVHLVRSQSLASGYKTQWEQSTLMGSGTVRPDVPSSVLPPFLIDNMAITNLNTLNFSGREAGFVVTFMGQYQINSTLWP
jgi:hypothetical protein